MNRQKRKSVTTRRSLKRKLEQDFEEQKPDLKLRKSKTDQNLERQIRAHVAALDSSCSLSEDAKQAAQALAELAKNETMVSVIVENGALPVLVKRLLASPPLEDAQLAYEYEVEKGSAFALGLLAIQPEYQERIVELGGLSQLVTLLKLHKCGINSRGANGVMRRAADAITNLAHENANIKIRVRMEGAIPLLVDLLGILDVKVQRAAAGALRTLAFKNEENKRQIVDCNGLPVLVLMLQSEDTTIHYEAVGVIGNLVHSSPSIKKEVLQSGALQPVIGLLSSPCSESQREAALLIGQFATADSDCKVHIVQRGAVRPLIDMLQSTDSQLKEMAAFALGRLAQDTHSQAGIAHSGGVLPLLKLLDSENICLQHNAAFALYGLADNEDNVADIIRLGGVIKLQDGEITIQPTKDCVGKTLKRLEEKIHGRILNHLLYLMRSADKVVQRRVALALAHLCSPDQCKTIFIDNNGLEMLLDLLESATLKQQEDSSIALHKLATKASSPCPMDAAPPSPILQVYLGEQYVNNQTLSDIIFLVEGKRFYAHRMCLLASSDAFRAMFGGGYKERDANDVEIPNIRWDVFELMMRFIYTGSVDIRKEIAQELLIAADQYLLEGLKRLCEFAIAKDITVENVPLMYELSEAYNATTLKQACIIFVLDKFSKLRKKTWTYPLIKRIIPEMRNYFTKAFDKPTKAEDHSKHL